MKPHLAPDALVLRLQNGVDNATACGRAEQEVAATVVYVATEMAGPGHVKHHGRGELVIGPRCERAPRPQPCSPPARPPKSPRTWPARCGPS